MAHTGTAVRQAKYSSNPRDIAFSLRSFSGNHTDLQSMLRKEAIYVACGVQPTALRNALNFSEWLTNTLAPEAQQTEAKCVSACVERRSSADCHSSAPSYFAGV